VWLAAGAVVATAVKTAAVSDLSTVTGVTDCTPGVFATACIRLLRRGSPADPDCAGVASFTPIRSGPFVPAPNPSVIVSYACRIGVEVGIALVSDWPRRSWKTGSASTSRRAVLRTITGQGRRPTA